ncbi:hypothetical protein NM208_g10210 [Fusarium decemcellulare]|uniref:Uncharacterized protein n=1 Tax=Fusarium decemcellulare TaxID=57161 RepID=A0ACC1RYU8_9HYPO|nr:hypothetical protein NM208_g10210 [Fusarium decemcellulare]
MSESDGLSDHQPEPNTHKELLLEWLTPTPYDSLQAYLVRRRHPGTCRWFLDSEPYQNWIRATSDSKLNGQTHDLRTLYCPGIGGAGKTFLSSVVIEDLGCRFRQGSASNVGVAYIYCTYDCDEEQSTTNLLLVFLEQLLQARPRHRPRTRLPTHTWPEYGGMVDLRGEPPSLDKITEALAKAIRRYNHVFLVIDALEECASNHRAELLRELFKLQTHHPIHLLATSDLDPEIAQLFVNTTSVDIRADEDDVGLYLEGGMPDFPDFVRDQSAVREEVKDAIIKSARGSFLRVNLQVQYLMDFPSVEDLRIAVADLIENSEPDNYDVLYEAAMRRIMGQAPDQVRFAKKILSYLLCARCPWSVSELCHALMVRVGYTELDDDTMPSIHDITTACAGLVTTVGETSDTENELRVRLAHRTTHEYLEKTRKQWLPDAEVQMARTCIAYLSLDYFREGSCYVDSDLENRLQSYPLYYYAALHWQSHAQAAGDQFPGIGDLGFVFLNSNAHVEAACQVVLKVGKWIQDDKYGTGFPRCMSGLHLAGYFGIVNLACALGGESGNRINAKDSWGRTALAWASHNGHYQTVEALIKSPMVDIDIRDRRGRTPISLAAEHNHTVIVEMLLGRGANPNFKDFHRATPLWHAVMKGNKATVDVLAGCGVDVNVVATESGLDLHTPLSLAAMDGQNDMVRLLLAQPNIQPCAKVKPSVTSFYELCTPLGLAINGGHIDVAEMLLSRADVVAAAKIDSNREMLLHMAVRQGDEDMVRLLLSKGVDVNARCDRGDTALQCAVDGAYDGVVRLLLSQPDIMPDLANKKGDTPASAAAHSGRIGILRLLLAAGVDTETRNEEGLTPLCLAAEQGYGSIVELLLTTGGIDADSRDNDGRTPLSLAALPSWGRRNWHSRSECDSDNCGVIRCLLQSGRVDVNSRDKVGRTPLIHAATNPQGLPALRTLLDYQGVDVNAVDGQGRTALAWDVGMWFEDKATLLLERGANPGRGRFESDETLLSCAAKEGKVGVVLAFVTQHGVDPQERNEDGHTAMCMAVKNGRTKVVEALLDVGGVDLNIRCGHGQTPMHHAAERGEEEVAALLLARGNVDLDARDENGHPNQRDIEGRTPLSLAAGAGRLQTVERLLSVEGVIPDTGDNTGRTPLSWAVQSSPEQASQAVIKRLLNTEGVDPNAEDERGWTPLSWAAQGTNAGNLIEFLLNEGSGRIDINREDRKGRTPLALALQRGDEVVVGQLRAAGAKLKKDSDEIREEVQSDGRRWLDDGEARDSVINEQEQEEGAADTMSEVSEEGPWQDPWRKERWKRDRRRWMDADWFEDDSGDDSDKETNWSGTSDRIYRRTRSPVKEAPIELGPQVEEDQPEYVIGDDGELCPRCEKLDLDRLFSRCPRGGFSVITPLGKVDESWEHRPCAMCRLIAAVRPRLWDADDYELCAYSSTATWVSRGKPAAQRYFRSNWVDTVVLGLESSSSWRYSSFNRGYVGGRGPWMGYSDILPYGFIGRIGANDHRQLRSITVHQLKVDSVDFERARDWIDYCKAHHGRRCHPKTSSTHGSITAFRLIDCTTREIVDGLSEVDRFVALSYVWGPQPDQAAATDHRRVEDAEPVVEDAIHATVSLGYKYLWVDRHCITNEDQEVRKRQLLDMNAVYENAQVTIVAAAGEDSSYGLPGVSRVRGQPYAKIQGHLLTAIPCEPPKSIKSSVWWTRGWTFQEGMLSRRRLMFTDREVTYECRGMVARESVELPMRIHRIAATRYPIQEYARVFTGEGRGRFGSGGLSIWPVIEEYTQRCLRHEHDILNAMLGILQVYADRKSPVYHLCGVPLVRKTSDETHDPTLLEALAAGLCWSLSEGGIRRLGFPSWSWTGWKGKVYGSKVSSISFEDGFAIEVSMLPRDAPSQALSWAEFETMTPKQKAGLPQNYDLKITATAVEVSLHAESPYDSDWHSIIYNGDDALKGSFELCKDPTQDTDFRRRLAEERFKAIVIGNERSYGNPLVLLILEEVGQYWERIGVIRVEDEQVLDTEGGGCRKQTFILSTKEFPIDVDGLCLLVRSDHVVLREFLQRACPEYTLNTPRPSALPLLVRINLLNALAHNAAKLSIPPEGICCADVISPFNLSGPFHPGQSPPSSLDYPNTLRPTCLQRTIVHHPWIDLFPFGNLRNEMLRFIALGVLDDDELCPDILELSEGELSDIPAMIVWGEPSECSSWEVNPAFLRKWGWLIRNCPQILEATNTWQARRGEASIITTAGKFVDILSR